MSDHQKYMSDISEIRNIMEKSSRFLSLSGLSGVLAGTYALIGAYIAYRTFYFSDEIIYSSIKEGVITEKVTLLIILALSILLLALGTAAVLSYRKSKKKDLPFWNSTAKRLSVNLMIPLVAGGILILILFAKGALGLIAPLTLIFYGLSLVNASKYTYEDVRTLGIIEIVLGLLSAWFIGYGLLFWAFGFGVMHIIYGIVVYMKYER
ncbi:MAG: hypothetical protein R3345_02305 [Fulvivirga sp.]|nr:hypothetical protein [Fulvivirga sp.]